MPFIHALTQKHEKCSPSQIRHLDWIGRFSTDIGHISGSLKIQGWTLNFCDVATRRCRPFVPKEFRRLIFETLHNLSHPGVTTTVKLVGDRFLWPGYKKQVAEWIRCFVPCQRGKIQRHSDRLTKSLVPSYSIPHLVVPRASKRFNIQVGSRQQTVSIDRPKTAFQLPEIQPFRVSFSI
ncbi:hypothetical protein AVEN_95121-1 [Araneus ventricosus]|uniref:Integrase zinc-binding domain-containing protein n=1 Tax=Araneus ventricosus TaxID=182803 RepID=A0A4Y2UFV7_ARAVE|nr:hypothetical protein AVEN_95121-1 [Araneus ventricosus]